MRSPLVVTSIGFHILVVAGFLVAGLWKLERLDGERRPIDIAVASPPPPASSGSPAAAPTEPFKKKQRTVTKALVQPMVVDPQSKPVASTMTDVGGTGGTGSGAGSGSGIAPTGAGDCTNPPCGDGEGLAKTASSPPKVEVPLVVPPTVIRGLRMSGDTQIHPPAPVKTAILRDGKIKVVATFRVCVGVDGEVSSTTQLKSSGYPGYDSAIDAGLRTWRYRAYEIGGRRVPVCGAVTFIYTMQ